MPDVTLEAAGVRWSQSKANAWYARQPWLVGANYLPSDAINQLEMFQEATWNPALNDRELGLAAGIGMNVVRVFLQDQLWAQDAVGFTRRIDEFLEIAAKHGIRVLLVLFDSCWNPEPQLGPQPAPVPGVHNSGWVQSPGARELLDPTFEPALEAYVRGVVRAFGADERVLGWDIWNEPDNIGGPKDGKIERDDLIARVLQLLPRAFGWVRAEQPVQPLTSGVWAGDWSDPERQSPMVRLQLAESDVITFHDYGWPEQFEARIQALLPLGRPVICTEYMARGAGSTFDGSLPVAKQYNVGAINWGLVAGQSQTYLPWDSWQHPYVDVQPPVWFHDVFRQDGTPYRDREVELIRELTGRGDFDDWDEENEDVLRRMREGGHYDMSMARDVDFNVVFPTQDAGRVFAERVIDLGYQVHLNEEAVVPELPWGVRVVNRMVPTNQGITLFERTLAELAQLSGGRNDGWGTLSDR